MAAVKPSATLRQRRSGTGDGRSSLRSFLSQALEAARRSVRSKAPLADTPSVEGDRFLFIGGLHRSGTSLVHTLLREHPDVSGFSGTGAREDEGQHLQSVFAPAYRFGGPGAFAFDARSRLNEESPLVSQDNRDRLLREWGAYYDLDRRLLIEKSPPNLVRARFLQALFPGAAFLFVVRHPVAVALATRKWTDATVIELLLHWQVAHSIMLRDVASLGRCKVIRYEDLIAAPQPCLDAICDLAGIERFAAQEAVEDRNAAYFAEWTRAYAQEAEILKAVLPSGTGPMAAFGYALGEPFTALP